VNPRHFLAVVAVGILGGALPVHGQDLGSARLDIAGARLTVSPESQTVPFDTPTVVETDLVGFDADAGVLPAGLRVRGELSGPGIEGVLPLETIPGQPLRIPRLARKGEYRLADIRLLDGDELLTYAEPRDAVITVTQILVTRVVSRPLTLDEIRQHGIVVDDSRIRAYNLSFGFAVAGEVFDYNVPIYYVYTEDHSAPKPFVLQPPQPPTSPRFVPPQLAPFRLEVSRPDPPGEEGCVQDCYETEPPPLPGVIFFPTDISLLHQFFSVVLMASNGAPAGDPLVIRDLTARIRLPGGLRLAETEPETPLGAPVPMRVPGPDGRVGTNDDLTFLVGQATAQGEFLVEGRNEGTHVVEFELEGILEGMPNGIRRLSGTARGAVVVRDPTLAVTITHPDVVAADEEYSLFLTVSNTANTPANLVTLRLDLAGLAGVEPIGPATRTVETIPPGESEVVEFRLRSLLTGRVIASAVRASGGVSPSFALTTGVGDGSIPLSPLSIVLPKEARALPAELFRHALGLVGLGFSLSSAPPEAVAHLPRLGRDSIHRRVFELAQAGRYLALGEQSLEAVAALAAEWLGVRDGDWEWDGLVRGTRRGALFADAVGATFAAAIDETSAEQVLERIVALYADHPPALLAFAEGGRLEIESRTTGLRLVDGEAGVLRDLPFAELYRAEGAALALATRAEASGFRVRLRGGAAPSADLAILWPDESGALRLLKWNGLGLDPSGEARVELAGAAGDIVLALDRDGDGAVDALVAPREEVVPPRPFDVVAAVQNGEVDKTGHIVDVLFTRDVDLGALGDPALFTLPGQVSNGGGSIQGGGVFERSGWLPSRLVRVAFSNPLSPYVEQRLTVRDVESAAGELLGTLTTVVVPGVSMPGTLVSGRVLGAEGEPLPFARVELYEVDYSNLPLLEDPCVKHRTAAVQADAEGRFLFDYVRQTECGGVFELRAHVPETQESASAFGRVRFIGQTVALDIVLLGRGTIRGAIRYDDGSVPDRLTMVVHHPVYQEGYAPSLDATGHYERRGVPVGPVAILARDGAGNFATLSAEIPSAGAVVEQDVVIVRRPELPRGELRGQVLAPDGTTPVYDAYLALYSGGLLVGVERSGIDGSYDFGEVPAGTAELEAFDGETGRSGARLYFELLPDRINEVDVLLRDERGVVEGHVYRRDPVTGVATPLAGAVVYLSGQPFNSTTDASGAFRLEDVFAMVTDLVAVDLASGETERTRVLLAGDGFHVVRDIYFDGGGGGTLAGEVLDYDGLPVAGAVVHVAASDTTWSHEARADGSGRFQFSESFAPGTYSLHAIRGEDGAAASATIQFPGQTTFTSLRFVRGTLRGQVRVEQPEGDPTPVVALVRYRTTVVRHGLVGRDLETHDLETDAEGRWELTGVLGGPYEVEVFNAFYGERSFRGRIVAQGEVHDLDVVYGQSGAVEGVVLGQDGVTPAAGARVALHHEAFADYEVVSDAEGRFRFEAVPPDPGYAFEIVAEAQGDGVLRFARVWAVVSRSGERVETRLILTKQGSVAGQVEISAGVPAVGAFVTLSGSEYPYQTATSQTDADGGFEFQNVFAGTISIGVRDLSGLGGRVSTELTDEGEEAFVLIQLEQVGAIQGRVVDPATGEAAAFSQVRLLRGGRLFDAVTTDAEGLYELVTLPLATYSVAAFDPSTGRSGRRDGLRVLFDGHVVGGDVTLEARGEAVGQVRDGADGAAVPNAIVELNSHALVPFATFVTTDLDGRYRFALVPQGEFTVRATDPSTRRSAAAEAEIEAENQVVERDLVLAPMGAVEGRVLDPNGSGALFSGPVSVLVTQSRIQVGASLENPFRIEGIRPDSAFELRVVEPGGAHRGQASGALAPGATTAAVDVRLWAIADVRARVLGAGGTPVAGAQVELRGYTRYGFVAANATADGAGYALFGGVGEGNLTLSAVDPATQLRGSRGFAIVQDGTEIAVDVTLEPAGTLLATVREADGETPAAGATAVARLGTREFYAITDSTGGLRFSALPLGTVALSIYGAAASGEWNGAAALTADGATVDLGVVVLDERPPQVIAVEPPDGAIGVPSSATVAVRFSEPMDPVRSDDPGDLALARVGGGAVALLHPHQWEDGNRVLRARPAVALDNFTAFRVIVGTHRLQDLAGRRLAAPFQSVFTTADARPPAVVSTTPAAGALNVAVDQPIRIRFDEAVAEASLSGDAIGLHDLDGGLQVTTTYTLLAGEREVLITPAGSLAEDHVHELRLAGVADRAGNAMALYTLRFETRDVTPPVIAATSPPAGTAVVSGSTLTLAATVVENQAMATVRFRFLGLDVAGVPDAARVSWSAALVVPPVAESQSAQVEVVATDGAGLTGTAQFDLTVEPLLDPDRPEVRIFCPSDGALLAPGTGLDVTAEAEDEQGLLKVEFFVGDATTPARTLTSPPFVYRLEAPTTALPGDRLRVRVVATDYGLKRGEATVEARIVTGAVFDTDFTLTPSNPNYEHETVIVTGGTFTFLGLHALENLVVLAPGRVTHPSTLDGAEFALDLALDGELYVGCGAAIDVTGRGYDGGSTPSGRGYGYGNTSEEGANPNVGGSHAGRGGGFDYSGPAYGSFLEPHAPGAGGGWGYGIVPGERNAGGGVIAIAAAGSMRIDGALLADGRGVDGVYGLPSGAGGSIWLSAPLLSGVGRISASGPADGRWGGGGGRVALHGEVDAELLARVAARGGPATGSSYPVSGAGTVFVKRPGDTHGELIVDNGGAFRPAYPREAWTELPWIGSGTVSAVGVDSITDDQADFRHSLAGLWVVAAADPERAWRVVGNDHHGQTLRLDVGEHPLDLTPGEPYRGEVRLDRLAVKGRARLLTQDAVATPVPPTIETGSELRVGDTAPPVVLTQWTPGAPGLPGQRVTLRVDVTDDHGLLDYRQTASGALDDELSRLEYGVVASSTTTSWTLPLAPAVPQLDVALTARDLFGRTTVVTTSLPIVADTTAPAIVPSSPAAGSGWVEGQTFEARAEVTDAAAVSQVQVRFDGVTKATTRISGTDTYRATFAVPAVEAEAPYEVRFEALDPSGNLGIATVTIQVRPPFSPEGPTIELVCPASGSPTVPGASQTMAVAASDPDGVAKVEFYQPGAATPFATDNSAPYLQSFTVPDSTPPGGDYVLRIRALDPLNHANEIAVPFRVVAATRIGSRTLAADDLSLEDQSVAVGSGALTVTGHHRFSRLLVLGGEVRPASAAAGAEPIPLDLEITEEIYVGCAGRISAEALGYREGRSFALEPLAGNVAGSHAGRGQGGGETFGSPVAPRAAGSGAGSGSSGWGGGIVRLATAGPARFDGTVAANANGHAAGGTIEIAAALVEGVGTIAAKGSLRGSGGRIALVAPAIDEALVERSSAAGGAWSGTSVLVPGGGAGTIYTLDSSGTFGRLIVDNDGVATTAPTELVPVGSGVIAAATESSLTVAGADFRHSLAGAWVTIAGDGEAPRRILANAHHGDTLELDPAVPGRQPAPGDEFVGFWRFDDLVVRGQAHLVGVDPIETTRPPQVEAGSTISLGGAEDLDASIQVDPGTVVLPNRAFRVVLFASDPLGVAELRVALSGRIETSQVVDGGGQPVVSTVLPFTMPIDPLVDHVDVHLEADGAGGATVVRDLRIAVPPDATPPQVTITAPAAGATVGAGTLLSIAATVSDDVGLRPTRISFGGLERVGVSSTSLYAPPVAEPTEVPIEVRAEDFDHNVTVATRVVTVLPRTDSVPPGITSLCPAEETMARPGSSVSIGATWSDDYRVHRAEWWVGDATAPSRIDDGAQASGATFTALVPEGAAPGSTLVVRLRVFDFGGGVTERTVAIHVEPGIEIAASVELAADDTSFEDETVYVAAGTTLTIEGHHRFNHLVLGSGATLRAPSWTEAAPGSLRLDLTGGLFVGCNARVLADAAGYPGAPATSCAEPAFTFPGARVGGAVGRTGGTHGGRGGGASPSEYGSLFRPELPGGGGGCNTGSTGDLGEGAAGGGAIHLVAGGSIQVDGAISANGGAAQQGGAGAGGSVWLEAARVAGAGAVRANGGSASSCGSGQSRGASGGGGRVALHSGTIDAALENRLEAGSPTGACYRGGPGTIYTLREGQLFGNLTIDNRSTTASAQVHLPAIGAGVVDAVSVDSFTDLEATFPWSVIGHEVAFRGDFSRLWAVVGQVPGETTLTLDVAGAPLDAQVGETYRGVLRLDRVAIRGRSNVVAGDVVFTTEPVEVDASSTWTSGNEAPPAVDSARIALGLGLFGAEVTGSAGAVVDAHPPIAVTLTNLTTDRAFTTTIAGDGSFTLPVAGADGDLLQLVAADSGEPPLSSAPLVLGPLTGGTGVVTTLPDGPRFFDGNVAIAFACGYQPQGPETVEWGELLLATYDVSNPAQPVELFRSYAEISSGGSEFEGCALANDAGHSVCELESGFSGCYSTCTAACAPEDWVCSEGCYATCASAEYQLCSEAAWRYEETCSPAASCDDGLAECAATCSAGGGAASCGQTCVAADAACRAAVPPDLGFAPLHALCGDVDFEAGVLAFAQGPYLRVVDLRDAAAPVFSEPDQTLQVLPEGARILGVDIDRGTVHVVERDSPQRHRLVDVRDPRHPRDLGVEQALSLGATRWISDAVAQEGELSLLWGEPYSSAASFSRYDSGAASSLLLLDSRSVSNIEVGTESLLPVEDVVVFPNTYFEGLATRHREEVAGDPLVLSELPYPPLGGVEVGDRFLLDYGGLASLGSLSTSRFGHGYVEETTQDFPEGSWGALRVGAGRLWVGAQGFLSRALQPWFEPSGVEARVVAGGAARVEGPPGAAGVGAVAVRVRRMDGSTVEGPVGADGSFALDVGGVLAGERLVVQAVDASGHAGNRERLRVLPGAPVAAIPLAAGAARMAIDGGLAVVVPAQQNPVSGPIELAVVATDAVAPHVVGSLAVTGAVSDVVLRGTWLYVAANRLEVFDLADPALPVAVASLDLFAGQPVLALVDSGTELRALGAAGSGQRLATLDLGAPASPVEVAGTSVAVSSVSRAQLRVADGKLYRFGTNRIERWTLPAGGAPVLEAALSSGSPTVVDLEAVAGSRWVAVEGVGLRSLVEGPGSLALGAAPARPAAALALADLPLVAGDAPFRVGGLAGLTRDSFDGRLVVPAECLLREAREVDARTWLLTDCGVEVFEVRP